MPKVALEYMYHVLVIERSMPGQWYENTMFTAVCKKMVEPILGAIYRHCNTHRFTVALRSST
ncbi:MAG: hypothetical protein N3F66_10320 [Spirochaetes bacterium]|nr:hypothetical protein [Spirochaetota bacterium]